MTSESTLRQFKLQRDPPPSKAAALVPPPLFKALTFGQWLTGIDWMWIQTLTDSNLSRVAKGEHPDAYYRFMMATELDPAFYYIYYAGANLLAIVRDDALGARDLLLRGNTYRQHTLPGMPAEFREKQWGRAWQISILLAYVHLFELNDIRSAASAFIEAAEIPGAPRYLQSLAHRFEKPGGEYEVGLRLLGFMIASEKNPRTLEVLERKRRSLFIGQFLFHLRKDFAAFLAANPKYRASARLSRPEMGQLWEKFRKAAKVPDRDPLEGRLSLDEAGRIVTSTPYEPVFGLE